MPSIDISDGTFGGLQQLAKPFVDTPESVIAGLVAAELQRRTSVQAAVLPTGASSSQKKLVRLEPDRRESLTHARLLSASVEGQALHRPKWNSLLDHVHVLARQRLGSFDAVKAATAAHVRPGRYVENGYHYVPQADMSIQGVDANLAWDHSLRLARQLGVSIEAKFEWRDKPGAAHPEEIGVIEWSPRALAIA